MKVKLTVMINKTTPASQQNCPSTESAQIRLRRTERLVRSACAGEAGGTERRVVVVVVVVVSGVCPPPQFPDLGNALNTCNKLNMLVLGSPTYI